MNVCFHERLGGSWSTPWRYLRTPTKLQLHHQMSIVLVRKTSKVLWHLCTLECKLFPHPPTQRYQESVPIYLRIGFVHKFLGMPSIVIQNGTALGNLSQILGIHRSRENVHLLKWHGLLLKTFSRSSLLSKSNLNFHLPRFIPLMQPSTWKPIKFPFFCLHGMYVPPAWAYNALFVLWCHSQEASLALLLLEFS